MPIAKPLNTKVTAHARAMASPQIFDKMCKYENRKRHRSETRIMVTTLSQEFWIGRELKKVQNANRRAFLRGVFAGEDGWRKFLSLMRTRAGANEFRTGEWQKTIPKYSKAELEAKRRPCIYGCDFVLPPKFSPWGELFEDFIPICPKCLLKIKLNNNKMQNMENQNPENQVTAITMVNPSMQQPDDSDGSGVTLAEMLAQYQNLNPVARIRLGEQIVKESREQMIKELAQLTVKMKELQGFIGEGATFKSSKRGPGRPRTKGKEVVSK